MRARDASTAGSSSPSASSARHWRSGATERLTNSMPSCWLRSAIEAMRNSITPFIPSGRRRMKSSVHADDDAVAVGRQPAGRGLDPVSGADGEQEPHLGIAQLVEAAEGEAELGQPALGDPLLGDRRDLRADRQRALVPARPRRRHPGPVGPVDGADRTSCQRLPFMEKEAGCSTVSSPIGIDAHSGPAPSASANAGRTA